MNSNPLLSSLSIILVSILLLSPSNFSSCSSLEIVKKYSSNNSFSLRLIHRDSPISPLYNPNEDPLHRFTIGIKHSIQRYQSIFNTNANKQLVPPSPSLRSNNGQYLVKYSIGNPPYENYGLVDTGSDLTWTQCQPCISCYNQTINSPFDPRKSSSYKNFKCIGNPCQLNNHVCSKSGNCIYTYAYGGGSYTVGNMASETFTFDTTSGTPTSIPNVVFGCGHNNSGLAVNEPGIFGLGAGPLSLVSQFGSLLGSRKYSQCLVPFRADPSITSRMSFGQEATVSGPGVITTPLVRPDEQTTYYLVTLQGYTVGGKFLPFNANNVTVTKGNAFLDSGTPPTLLPQELYTRLENEVMAGINMQPIASMRPHQLCYNSADEISAPIITAHLDGGAKVDLLPVNSFIKVQDNTWCFTFTSIPNATGAIIGNYAQINFLIGVDLDNKVVSFKPTDCSQHH